MTWKPTYNDSLEFYYLKNVETTADTFLAEFRKIAINIYDFILVFDKIKPIKCVAHSHQINARLWHPAAKIPSGAFESSDGMQQIRSRGQSAAEIQLFDRQSVFVCDVTFIRNCKQN